MRLLPLLMVLFIGLPAIFAPPVQAWSPLERFEAVVDWNRHCDSRVIGDSESEEDENSDEEEEPDCE